MLNSLDTLSRHRWPLRISTDVSTLSRSPSNPSSSSSSSTNPTITPSGTIPKSGNFQRFFHVMCIHDFESSDPDHLPFHEGETLMIIKREHSGWWAAMRLQGDRIGWIPNSYVLRLDGYRIVEYPNEEQWSFGSLNDPPVSAVHDPWVPVSKDHKVPSLQLVTPTDLILYKSFFDEKV